MGFFKIFNKTSACDESQSISASSATASITGDSVGDVVGGKPPKSVKSRPKSSESKSKRLSKGKDSKKGAEKSVNIQTAEAMIKGFNNFTSEDKITKLFTCPDTSTFVFEDDFTITPRQWAQVAGNTKASFPNMKFDYESIKEVRPNKIEIEGLCFSGTHTGEPFTFAPPFPAIPATGIHVVNDEERLIFTMEDDKIKSVEVISLGAHTGPPGAYEQIGGCLIPPSPEVWQVVSGRKEGLGVGKD